MTPAVVSKLRTSVVCGAANNQLSTDAVAEQLRNRKIVYVPDFIANAGGLMYASGIEVHHRSEAASEKHTRDKIAENVTHVLEQASDKAITTRAAALELARRRLCSATRWPAGQES